MFYCFEQRRRKRDHCGMHMWTQCYACDFVERNGYLWDQNFLSTRIANEPELTQHDPQATRAKGECDEVGNKGEESGCKSA